MAGAVTRSPQALASSLKPTKPVNMGLIVRLQHSQCHVNGEGAEPTIIILMSCLVD